MIWLGVLIYCAIGYWFHSCILSEYAKDRASYSKDIPVWFIKTVFLVCALFWPLLICWALAEAYFKKEDM